MNPSLFILGAPKSGTTTLCNYLAQHPEVCFSKPKEPKYFHTDFLEAHRYARSERQYLECFSDCSSGHKIAAEGTVWYLYSKVAVKNILQFNEAAKFIVMLRNPVDLVVSLHSQLYYGGDEDIADFTDAWRLQETRRNGKKVPSNCRDVKSLLYGDVGKLGSQVKRLLREVKKDSVKFICFDEFSHDTERVYAEVIEFAGLSPFSEIDYKVLNENKSLRSGPLPKALFFAKRVKDALGLRKSFHIWNILQPLISKQEKRQKLNHEIHDELVKYFSTEIDLLQSLTGLELSMWKNLK